MIPWFRMKARARHSGPAAPEPAANPGPIVGVLLAGSQSHAHFRNLCLPAILAPPPRPALVEGCRLPPTTGGQAPGQTQVFISPDLPSLLLPLHGMTSFAAPCPWGPVTRARPQPAFLVGGGAQCRDRGRSGGPRPGSPEPPRPRPELPGPDPGVSGLGQRGWAQQGWADATEWAGQVWDPALGIHASWDLEGTDRHTQISQGAQGAERRLRSPVAGRAGRR